MSLFQRGGHIVLGKMASSVERAAAEELFDSQQLVVLGHAIAARRRTGLDLPGASADGQIREVARFQDTVVYRVVYDYVVLRGADGTELLQGTLEAEQGFPVLIEGKVPLGPLKFNVSVELQTIRR